MALSQWVHPLHQLLIARFLEDLDLIEVYSGRRQWTRRLALQVIGELVDKKSFSFTRRRQDQASIDLIFEDEAAV